MQQKKILFCYKICMEEKKNIFFLLHIYITEKSRKNRKLKKILFEKIEEITGRSNKKLIFYLKIPVCNVM